MNSQFFATDCVNRAQCERLFREYTTGKHTKAAFSTFYDACKQATGSQFILKVTASNCQIDECTSQVDMHNLMVHSLRKFDHNFLPQMHDAWDCLVIKQPTFFAIIERYDGNLFDLISSFPGDDPDIQKLLNTIIHIVLKNLQGSLYYVHNTCNICINDIKLENILYKETANQYVFVFADFGITTGKCSVNKDPKCKQEDARKLEVTIQTFLNELGIEE
jgi:serine/threonine protein kinase